MGVLTAPEQAAPEQDPQLTTDEAMNQAFGTPSEEDEGEEDEGEEVNKEEMDRGHQDGLYRTGVSSTTTCSSFWLTFIISSINFCMK
jgi:hypothetical protein